MKLNELRNFELLDLLESEALIFGIGGIREKIRTDIESLDERDYEFLRSFVDHIGTISGSNELVRTLYLEPLIFKFIYTGRI